MNMPSMRRPKMLASPAVARRSAGVMRTLAEGLCATAGSPPGGGGKLCDIGGELRKGRGLETARNCRYSSRLPGNLRMQRTVDAMVVLRVAMTLVASIVTLLSNIATTVDDRPLRLFRTAWNTSAFVARALITSR